MSRQLPLLENFICQADNDLISFAVLNHYMIFEPAVYHAVQAIEKYLKALALSLAGTQHKPQAEFDDSWLRTHDLVKLAERCSKALPFYGEERVIDDMTRFSELNNLARFPIAEQLHWNGFSTSDHNRFEEIILHLRTDIPIVRDDYPLGCLIRGYKQGKPLRRKSGLLPDSQRVSAALLRNVITRADQLVRW